MDTRQCAMMVWIDWLYLDWYVISAAIFGILLALYVVIRLKNYFFRWSTSPPKFIQPFVIHQEVRSQRGVKQTEIIVEGEGERLDPVIIWIIGKCPRFLGNIAYGLGLQVKSVLVNEVKSLKNAPRQIDLAKSDVNYVFYRKAGQFGNDFGEQNRIRILLAPPIKKDLKNIPRDKNYIIMGRRITQKGVETLKREGNNLINLKGGSHFRGWELALLAELIAIFKKNKGTS